MAFESLTDKLGNIFKKLRGQARLTEANMEAMLKEIRVALLEADVNYKVVKEFVNKVKEKALGQDVLSKLNPSQMVVKIVHEELVELLGADDREIPNRTEFESMLVGGQFQ
jgi:signal recognition particle subunit SRP54